MKQQEIVNALNELLKNTMITIEMYEDLKKHLKSEQLIREMNEFLFEFHTHKKSLEGLIRLYHGELENLNIVDVMNEYYTKMKQMMINEDVEVITHALTLVNKQHEGLKHFVQTYDLEYDHIKKTCAIMHEDYKAIYHKLRKYQILFA